MNGRRMRRGRIIGRGGERGRAKGKRNIFYNEVEEFALLARACCSSFISLLLSFKKNIFKIFNIKKKKVFVGESALFLRSGVFSGLGFRV